MTLFDVRDWAEIIGRAVPSMPLTEAASLIVNAYRKIKERRPDFDLGEWLRLVEKTSGMPCPPPF
ncbi:hypothetical protein [Actinomadura atramentaria]|uniref:hypothetical protein n=1 Tax=Actinomadura atramentaria TaxID=1990 RepID=UPI00035D8FDA|nr:hypothetical protein [Actinomadura atramentaria]